MQLNLKNLWCDFMTKKRLLSHNDFKKDLEGTIRDISQRIKNTGDKPHVTVERQLDLLTQLSQFDFGRFLLQNQGINGYWTHYMLTYPWYGKQTGKDNLGNSLPDLEKFILENAPTIIATQQRFRIFFQESLHEVNNDAVLASIPCGMMGELLYLNFEDIKSIRLVGIDYDTNAFEDAANLAEKQKLSQFVEFHKKDAWNLNLKNEFDLISSNGLNIYEPDNKKVSALYKQFYNALKSGGKLVTSFITPPPNIDANSEWKIESLNPEHLLLQQIIFADIIDAKWQCFQSTEKMHQQLASIGFRNIEFIYDDAHMFPTVVAFK